MSGFLDALTDRDGVGEESGRICVRSGLQGRRASLLAARVLAAVALATGGDGGAAMAGFEPGEKFTVKTGSLFLDIRDNAEVEY